MCKPLRSKDVIGCIIAIICIISAVFFNNADDAESDLPVRKFESGNFVLEGESVFFGTDKVSHCHVIEQHSGNSCDIDRMEKRYVRDGNLYYIDEGDGKVLVDFPPEDETGIEEMFARKSELSAYCFSERNLVMIQQGFTDLPTIDGRFVRCFFQEYHLKNRENEKVPPLKLYFLEDKLYAIQSRDDERFVFYVERLE